VNLIKTDLSISSRNSILSRSNNVCSTKIVKNSNRSTQKPKTYNPILWTLSRWQ